MIPSEQTITCVHCGNVFSPSDHDRRMAEEALAKDPVAMPYFNCPKCGLVTQKKFDHE